MFPLTSSELDDLQKDDLKSLVKLDDNGFFAGVGESFADFKTRLAAEKKELKKFAEDVKNNKEVKIFDDIKVSQNDLIGKDIMREATKKTRELYDFEIDYLPGFFLNKDIGLLWGGCSIYDEETHQRIFLISKKFF